MDITPSRAVVLTALACLAASPAGARPPTINLTIKNADVRSVVTFVADEAGLNVVFSPAVSGRVTMSLVGVRPMTALRAILRSQGLVAERHRNVLVVMSRAEHLSALEARIQRQRLRPPPPRILTRSR